MGVLYVAGRLVALFWFSVNRRECSMKRVAGPAIDVRRG